MAEAKRGNPPPRPSETISTSEFTIENSQTPAQLVAAIETHESFTNEEGKEINPDDLIRNVLTLANNPSPNQIPDAVDNLREAELWPTVQRTFKSTKADTTPAIAEATSWSELFWIVAAGNGLDNSIKQHLSPSDLVEMLLLYRAETDDFVANNIPRVFGLRKKAQELKGEIPESNKPETAQTSKPFPSGAHEEQGRRTDMEDVHLIIPDFLPGQSLYGVFDGHGGRKTASHCKTKVPNFLRSNLSQELSIQQALAATFSGIDQQTLRLKMSSGSTALVAHIDTDNKVITVANAGDCRAVLVSDKQVTPLSTDHDLKNEAELERIKQAGVEIKTISGMPWIMAENGHALNISRGIGDRFPAVIPDPEITQHTIVPEDEFLILACDGLWRSLSNQAVVRETRKHIRKGLSLDQVAAKLTKKAMDKGSGDNITVIVIDLRQQQTA